MRKTALLAALIATVMVIPIAAYAIHSFTDVSDSAFFHNSVEWMKTNNVTAGCNPPTNDKYCPNDNVSRGEMAVFLKRLAEFKVVDAATAVNADNATKLGGDSKSSFQQWGDTLPPDESLTGAWGLNGDGFVSDNITFSTPLPGDIPGSDTHFLAVGDPTTAECPGPGVAAPGHLCVYEVETSGSITFHCFCDPETTTSDQAQSYGTVLFMNASGGNRWSYGSWTVTSASGLGELSFKTQSQGDPDSPGS